MELCVREVYFVSPKFRARIKKTKTKKKKTTTVTFNFNAKWHAPHVIKIELKEMRLCV